jgi:septal ring factor EnvC (AmiA/AmiB activator)
VFCFSQDESLRTRKNERENLGVELYGIQQELARYQMMLERKHDEFTSLNQQRQREEQQLTEVRGLYKDSQLTFNKEKKKCEPRHFALLSVLFFFSI